MAENKNLLWTERVTRLIKNWQGFSKAERYQYRLDTKALLCRDHMEQDDVSTVQRGLHIETGVFWLSRAYVPLALYFMFRRGRFDADFSFTEIKHLFRIALTMHCIDLSGHFAFRMTTGPIVDKYVGLN